MPVTGVLSAPVTDGGRTFVEVQAEPVPAQSDRAGELDFGLPTFYLVLDAGSDLVPFADGDAAPEGESLATAAGVSILCAAQDRVGRDPALWSSLILDALPAADRAGVAALRRRGRGRLRAAPTGRCSCSTITGAPLESGRFEIESGPQTATAELIASDGGDLQRAVARMHACEPGHDAPHDRAAGRRRPGTGAAAPAELRRRSSHDSRTGLTPRARSRSPPSSATSRSRTCVRGSRRSRAAGAPVPLADYTRQNRLTPYVNGREYYDHLFRRL